MKRYLSICLSALIINASFILPTQAANGDWAAFLVGALIGLTEDESTEQAKRQRDLEVQNEQMRRYISERILNEQRIRDAERQRIDAEIQQRKAIASKPDISTSIGSGFFLPSPGYLITNAHVIEGGHYFYVRDRDGKLFMATVIARDGSADLALLQVKSKRRGLPISQFSSVSKGQKVYAIGYPVPSLQGGESKITDGIISSFTGSGNDDKRFQVSTPIQPGNSGGPLINERAEVVGVAVAKASEKKYLEASGTLPQNVNYAVRTDVLAKFLKTHNIDLGSYKALANPLDYADSNTVMIIATSEQINLPVDTETSIAEAEADAWLKARNQETCGALDSYINIYKGSKNYPSAVKTRAAAELKAWNEAKNANTITRYREYESNCPGNTHKTEIEKNIAAIESQETQLRAELDQLNTAAKGNNCQDLETYISKNPSGRYLANARDYLHKTEEGKYNYAIKAKSIAAWDDLTEKCPNSRYVAEAIKARAELAEKLKSQQLEKTQIAEMRGLFNDKKYEELQRYAQKIIDAGNAKDAPYTFAGLANFKLGRLIKAEEQFRKANTIAPNDLQIRLALGYVTLRLGNTKEAVDYLSEAETLKLEPSDKAILFQNLAVAHYRQLNDVESRKYVDKLAAIDQIAAEQLRKSLNFKDPGSFFGFLQSANNKRVTEDQWWASNVSTSLLDGDWTQAANLSVIYTERLPNTHYGWYERALAKFALDDKEDANKSFAEGYRRNPEVLAEIVKIFAKNKSTQMLNAAHSLLVTIDPVAAEKLKGQYLSANDLAPVSDMQDPTKSQNNAESLLPRFVAGAIRLDCRLTCAMQYGSNRRNLAQLYSRQAWEELANEIIRIGYRDNTAYYYLGRSAEGLGHKQAASTYYQLGKQLPNRCTEESSKCSGLVFPREFDIALQRITQ